MALTRYGELRNQLMRQSFPGVFAPAVLRDADSGYVPLPISERLVQCIWYDQRLLLDQLRTTDDRAVRVIFPGWWNLEGGPDFRHATVQLGNGPELSGDIEIHLRADDWAHHGHERDAHYNNVILHVVLWEAGSQARPRTRAGDTVPQLVLQHHLAASLESLYDEIDIDAYPHNAAHAPGRCGPVLQTLPPGALAGLLDSAGAERFAIKTRKFARWLQRVGAAQAFYEGWMESLGYKGNKAAFRTLAQQVPLDSIPADKTTLAATLFGVANFLPTETPAARGAAAQAYAKRLWRAWWKLRPEFAERIMLSSAWRLHGVRPANHPHRRLGAAAALLTKHPQLMDNVVGAIASGGDPVKLLTGVRDEFWCRHFTLSGRTQPKPTELIGERRAQEIVTNVVLPFVTALAQDQADAALEQKARAVFAATPAAPSNSVLRLAGEQLFGNAANARPFLKSEQRQQGLMQIFQDFCLNDKSGCQQCQFPELARRWGERPAAV